MNILNHHWIICHICIWMFVCVANRREITSFKSFLRNNKWKYNILVLPLTYKVTIDETYSFFCLTCYNLLKYPALEWLGETVEEVFACCHNFFHKLEEVSIVWICLIFFYMFFFIVWWRAGNCAIQQLSLILIIQTDRQSNQNNYFIQKKYHSYRFDSKMTHVLKLTTSSVLLSG